MLETLRKCFQTLLLNQVTDLNEKKKKEKNPPACQKSILQMSQSTMRQLLSHEDLPYGQYEKSQIKINCYSERAFHLSQVSQLYILQPFTTQLRGPVGLFKVFVAFISPSTAVFVLISLRQHSGLSASVREHTNLGPIFLPSAPLLPLDLRCWDGL